MKRYRKVILLTLLFLFVGAVVNVAVAWGFAVYGSIRRPYRRGAPSDEETAWWAGHAPGHGNTLRPVVAYEWGGRGLESGVIIGALDEGRSSAAISFNRTDSGFTFKIQGHPRLDHGQWLRCGWPWPALQGSRWDQNLSYQPSSTPLWPGDANAWNDRTIGQSARPLPTGLPGVRDASIRLLPLGVLWPGLVANSALYALSLSAVIAFAIHARRAWRRRAGRCMSCGYSLAGNASGVCPECGAAVG